MPLIRDRQDDYRITRFDGVKFWMRDTATNERVLCNVSYAALCDRASFDGTPDEWSDVWRKHREQIEALASANYEADKQRIDGMVVVTSGDLTPLSHQTSYFQSTGSAR